MTTSFCVVNFVFTAGKKKLQYDTCKIHNIRYIFFLNLGIILNVECAVIKAAEGFERLDVDPNNTVFHENGGKLRRYTQIIRIFYVIGSPSQETIGGLQILLVHACSDYVRWLSKISNFQVF